MSYQSRKGACTQPTKPVTANGRRMLIPFEGVQVSTVSPGGGLGLVISLQTSSLFWSAREVVRVSRASEPRKN